jgi:hypothetical protein
MDVVNVNVPKQYRKIIYFNSKDAATLETFLMENKPNNDTICF